MAPMWNAEAKGGKHETSRLCWNERFCQNTEYLWRSDNSLDALYFLWSLVHRQILGYASGIFARHPPSYAYQLLLKEVSDQRRLYPEGKYLYLLEYENGGRFCLIKFDMETGAYQWYMKPMKVSLQIRKHIYNTARRRSIGIRCKNGNTDRRR